MAAEQDEALEFQNALQAELDDCFTPSLQDLQGASTDDVVREIYRILSGNGNPTHGLLFKVAASAAHVKMVKRHVQRIGTSVDKQVLKCEEIQAAKLVQSQLWKGNIAMRALALLWALRTPIFLLMFFGALYFSRFIVRPDDIDAVVRSAVDSQMAKLVPRVQVPAVTPAPTPVKKP